MKIAYVEPSGLLAKACLYASVAAMATLISGRAMAMDSAEEKEWTTAPLNATWVLGREYPSMAPVWAIRIPLKSFLSDKASRYRIDEEVDLVPLGKLKKSVFALLYDPDQEKLKFGVEYDDGEKVAYLFPHPGPYSRAKPFFVGVKLRDARHPKTDPVVRYDFDPGTIRPKKFEMPSKPLGTYQLSYTHKNNIDFGPIKPATTTGGTTVTADDTTTDKQDIRDAYHISFVGGTPSLGGPMGRFNPYLSWNCTLSQYTDDPSAIEEAAVGLETSLTHLKTSAMPQGNSWAFLEFIGRANQRGLTEQGLPDTVYDPLGYGEYGVSLGLALTNAYTPRSVGSQEPTGSVGDVRAVVRAQTFRRTSPDHATDKSLAFELRLRQPFEAPSMIVPSAKWFIEAEFKTWEYDKEATVMSLTDAKQYTRPKNPSFRRFSLVLPTSPDSSDFIRVSYEFGQDAGQQFQPVKEPVVIEMVKAL